MICDDNICYECGGGLSEFEGTPDDESEEVNTSDA